MHFNDFIKQIAFMEHDYIKYLKENNLTIKLLRLDNAPLIISFLYNTFKHKNRNAIPNNELLSKLADYLYEINENKVIYPLEANDYLQKWANEGFLRTWYEPNNDEPLFELTPATEKAVEFIIDLNKKDFVATESRLLNVFNILKDMAYKNFYEPDKKIRELERQKANIDFEIARIKAGNAEKLGETRLKERFMEAEETARKLLADFKQIEQNFRDLDQEARKKQINSNLSKGKVLDDIFEVHDLIWNTDQGKSFKAFWRFLLSQDEQDEFNELIEIVMQLPEVQDVKSENVLERLKVNLIEAGDKVNKTNSLLIEQLRRFLHKKQYMEDRRMLDLINSIEASAVNIKNNPPLEKDFLSVDDKVKIESVMERPLYMPPKMPEISDFDIEEGIADISTSMLYQHLYIDAEELKLKISNLLKGKAQISLKEIVEAHPVEKGLAEIITYFSIASKDSNATINEELYEKILIYNNETDKYSEVRLPQTIFGK
jgi:hypothetical protein